MPRCCCWQTDLLTQQHPPFPAKIVSTYWNFWNVCVRLKDKQEMPCQNYLKYLNIWRDVNMAAWKQPNHIRQSQITRSLSALAGTSQLHAKMIPTKTQKSLLAGIMPIVFCRTFQEFLFFGQQAPQPHKKGIIPLAHAKYLNLSQDRTSRYWYVLKCSMLKQTRPLETETSHLKRWVFGRQTLRHLSSPEHQKLQQPKG